MSNPKRYVTSSFKTTRPFKKYMLVAADKNYMHFSEWIRYVLRKELKKEAKVEAEIKGKEFDEKEFEDILN